ncbi:hypothetical protein [Dongia rigui]|uniref:Uncharacterized protein n=1 Tax=Dongia rigui TaxID=940149 RepID=A0ABU5DXN2_9PROT|nr:hypothetical protein [Dongia rigui]MDY0871699.1 hypothetical protein [Dongia rigui]
MISGRISFVAGMVGLGLTGHRAEQQQQQKHHPLPLAESAKDDAEATPMQTGRRYRLLSLLKGTTF